MQPSEHLAIALDAARAAADIAKHYYQTNVAVETKADRTPVTVADVECEQAIRRIILDRYPEHGFYGEETGERNRDAQYLWLVDPIDGTKAFVRQYPYFSTQIALMRDGELVLGVSSAPVYGEMAWAEQGLGAWLNGRRIEVSAVDTIEDCALSAGNIHTLAASDAWPGYGRLVARVNRIRGYGDFCHYHLLASGAIDAVVESDVNILDIAALSVIVREAGGRFTDLDGGPVGLETTSVLATNGRLHDSIAAFLSP